MLDATPFAIAVIGALAYGCSDFAGGRASIRLPTLAVAAVAQGIAALGVLALVLASGAVLPRQGEAGLAALAGVGHVAGVLFLYHGIAHGRVAIVVPISAVSGLALPIIGDLVTGEAPALIHLAGVAIAIFSVVLFGTAADAGPVAAPARTSVLLGLATGLGFGISDLGLGLMPEDLAVGALMFARLSGAAAAAVVVAVLMPRRAGSIVAGLAVGAPGRSARLLGLALALAAGLLDATGQLAYVLAATRGQMSIAAATTALYPAVVVALSIWLLKERICRTQLTGMLAGGVSIALMAA